jgi:hypothetical protein
MTTVLVVAQICAHDFVRAVLIELYLLSFLLADGYPTKMIKRTHLQ